MYVHMYVCVHVHMCVSLCVCLYVCVYTCICVGVFVNVFVCVCICMSLCVHAGHIHATENTGMSKDTLCRRVLVFASNHVISQGACRSSDLAASASTSEPSHQKVQFWELYLCVSFFLILRWMHIFLIVVLFSEKLILNISSYLPLLFLIFLIMNSCLLSSFVINGPLFTENGHVVINQHPQLPLLFYT